MIYEMVVVSAHPIAICSARKRKSLMTMLNRGESPPHESFADLLRVNKMLYNEATEVYYRKNIFLFGVGEFGSTTEINVDGLKAFLRIVPKGLIALIRSVYIKFFACRTIRGGYTLDYYVSQRTRESEDFCVVAKALAKYVKDLKALAIFDEDRNCMGSQNEQNRHPKICQNLQQGLAAIFGSCRPGLLDFSYIKKVEVDYPIMNIRQCFHNVVCNR